MTAKVSADSVVVIIGAGHAGATLAGLLRQQRFEGLITLVGDEIDPPYHRPPLSKKFADEAMVQWLKPARFYPDNGIELLLGVRATNIDPHARRVNLDNGEYRDYRTVVIATGATPRKITVPGADASVVLTLRTIADARRLRTALERTEALAIVGGG